jgi:alpha-1,2-mannosyltransferase
LSPLGGPDLYGTSPATYYLQNLFLNFNFLTPMAVISLPALAITYQFDYKRLGKSQMKPVPGQTSPYTLMIARMAPFYIWLGILSAQAHKEERFFFPAYPLLCFNAAVTIFLARGWAEVVYVKITKSPWQVSDLFLAHFEDRRLIIRRAKLLYSPT